MTIFGMVTTARSDAYTPHALRSFFRHTPFAQNDRFFLVDNDAVGKHASIHRAVTLLQNPQPLGFAANVNQVMRFAAEHRADLVFLNNDLIFTPGWFEPLLVGQPALVSATSNWTFQYRVGNFDCRRALDLEDYLGHETALEQIAHQHRAANPGYERQFRGFFFCIRIPFAVYSTIGALDESFGRGGGEDVDYSLRCHLGQVPVLQANPSFVLHFAGKSTWRGGESPDEIRQREHQCHEAFVAKWGALLWQLAMAGDFGVIAKRPDLATAFAKSELHTIVEQLRQPLASKSPRPPNGVPSDSES